MKAEIISNFEEMSLHVVGQRALSYNHYEVRQLPACTSQGAIQNFSMFMTHPVHLKSQALSQPST